MKFAKAQAAMEYLMTYGWAILVIVIVLAALLYLGVFTPKPPEFCQMPPGLGCTSAYLDSSTDELSITIYNSFQKDMTVIALGCTDQDGATYTCTVDMCGAAYPPDGATIPRGSGKKFTLPCYYENEAVDFSNGETYIGKVNIKYYFSDEAGSNRMTYGKVNLVAN